MISGQIYILVLLGFIESEFRTIYCKNTITLMALDLILVQNHISCHEKQLLECIRQNIFTSFEKCLLCHRICTRIQNICKEIIKLDLHRSCEKIQQQNDHNRKGQFSVSCKCGLPCNIPLTVVIRIDKIRCLTGDLIKELVHVSDLRNSKIYYFDFVGVFILSIRFLHKLLAHFCTSFSLKSCLIFYAG